MSLKLRDQELGVCPREDASSPVPELQYPPTLSQNPFPES